MASSSRTSAPSLQSDPLETAEGALEKLRDAADWDEPTRPTLVVNMPMPAAAVPPPEERRGAATANSLPPVGTGVVIAMWRRLPPWGGVTVAVVAIVAYTILRLAGVDLPGFR